MDLQQQPLFHSIVDENQIAIQLEIVFESLVVLQSDITRISLRDLGTEWGGNYLCQRHWNHASGSIILVNLTLYVFGDKEYFDLSLYGPFSYLRGCIKLIKK